jgi:homoserine dehydrogenase
MQHPLAKVNGAFNAVMLQGDAIREITLEGPGAGGIETASAVIADMASVIGTMGTGFLQNDAAWRALPKLPASDSTSPFYFRLSVEDRPGALARVAEELAQREISIARLLQHQNGSGAALHVVTHEARVGALDDALVALGSLAEVHATSQPMPVVSDRGVTELGWA